MELLPGSYKGESWGGESIFFDEETFGFLEPTIEKHVQNYDHYAFTEVARTTWQNIIFEFEFLLQIASSNASEDVLKSKLGFVFKSTDNSKRCDFDIRNLTS